MSSSRSIPDGLPVVCNRDCGATCSMVARQSVGGEWRLFPNPLNHPLKKPCPRGLKSPLSRNAPDRLTTPLIRTGPRGNGEFRPVSWDEAISEVAGGLSRIREEYGAQAILNAGGSGACKGALHNTGRLTSRFLNLLGPVSRIVGNYSFQAAAFVLPYAYGTSDIGYDARTLMDTRFVILWGANIADTRFGNETEQVIRHIRSSGGEVIVIDPRRSRTAKQLGTEWIPIRPGTDAAAMLAIAWVLFDEVLVDDDFVSNCVHGAEQVRDYVMGGAGSPGVCGNAAGADNAGAAANPGAVGDRTPKTPEWAETICGIPAATLRKLARRYAAARPAALIPGFSIQRTLGGEDAFRMSVALQALTGNTGRAGGTPGTSPWFGPSGPVVPVLDDGEHAGAELPKLTWPRVILGGRKAGYAADIRAIYFVGSNYLNQGSDVGENIRALESLDLVVCHENFLTPTARYADVVLPASHFLEREDVIVAEDNYLYYAAKVFEHPGEVRDDYDIFADLAVALGVGDAFTGGLTKDEWVNRIIDGSDVGPAGREEFKRTGIYDPGEHSRWGLAEFVADPVTHRLDTPSGKIEISSERYAETGFPAWPVYRPVERDSAYPLMMVTPHSRYRINSTGGNLEWVRERDPIMLWINPEDAAARGIADGAPVRVASPTGGMETVARVTADIMPGVACCSQGGWHGTPAGPSANEVTPLDPTMPSGGTRTHSVCVQVERVDNQESG